MFEMWRLMDWRVYCYDKISQWKANLMAISKSRILWSKVMLQINSGGRPSLSRFTSRVFHAHLLWNRLQGGKYLFIYLPIHPYIRYIYFSTLWTMSPLLQFSQPKMSPGSSVWPSLTFLTAICPLIVEIVQYVTGWPRFFSHRSNKPQCLIANRWMKC